MKNNYNIYIVVSAVVVLVAAVSLFLRWGSDKNNSDVNIPVYVSPTPTSVLELSPTPTFTPKPTTKTANPSPSINVQEVRTYRQWAEELDLTSRRLAITDDTCTELVPSNATYPNNTQLMLDNSYSNKSHILKIGGREYILEARGWLVTTFSSSQLPAQLPIYCGGIELGRIDLE